MALVVGSTSGSFSASSSAPSITTSSPLSLPDDLEPLVGGTTTVIFSSPLRSLLVLNPDVGAPAVSSPISTSSEPFTPFSVDFDPFVCESFSPISPFDAPFASFLAGADLALLAAARVVGAALSFALELWEFERAFSPLADEEVSDLLFDRKERLSAGIFLKLSSSGEQPPSYREK
jgi:hypothetical protein